MLACVSSKSIIKLRHESCLGKRVVQPMQILGFDIKVGVHQESVSNPLLSTIVMSRKFSWGLLYADVLVFSSRDYRRI